MLTVTFLFCVSGGESITIVGVFLGCFLIVLVVAVVVTAVPFYKEYCKSGEFKIIYFVMYNQN